MKKKAPTTKESIKKDTTKKAVVKGGKSAAKTVVKGKVAKEDSSANLHQEELPEKSANIVKPLKSSVLEDKKAAPAKIQTAEGWKRSMQKLLKK